MYIFFLSFSPIVNLSAKHCQYSRFISKNPSESDKNYIADRYSTCMSRSSCTVNVHETDQHESTIIRIERVTTGGDKVVDGMTGRGGYGKQAIGRYI